MSNYSLTVQIDGTDLPTLLAAGQQTVLVRQLKDAGQNVAWAVLALAPNRTMTWNSDYSLFGSNTPNVTGNVVGVAASTAAVLRCDYDYSAAGFSTPTPDGSLSADMVQASNTVPASTAPSVMLGLAQAYAVDGGTAGAAQPLNAQTVPALQIAQYTVSQDVWIYLASGISAGMIVRTPVSIASTKQVMSVATLLQFGPTTNSQTVRYSSVLGRFYLSS